MIQPPPSPLLAIAIPTFNRADLLGLLLDSIARDFESWPADLDLVVIDNASTDGTHEEVARRIGAGMPIRLLRNERNIGMDGNLAACFNATDAKYFWQIGDDEVLHAGACRFVLEFCRRHEFGLLHIASVGFAKGGQAGQFARRIPRHVKLESLASPALLRKANVFLTFISANVVNRRAVIDGIEGFDASAETGTFLPQLAWIYGALKVSDRHFHVRTPLFGALGGNTSGYRLIEVFGVNLLSITERQLGQVIPAAKRVIGNAVLTRLLPAEIVGMSRDDSQRNRFEAEELAEAIDRAFGAAIFSTVFVKPLLSGPAWAQRAVFFLVRAFNKLNRISGYRCL